MNIIIVQRTPTVDEYIEICRASGLVLPDPDVIAPGLANSLYSVCAIDGDQAIGMARVIGDGGIFFEIVDVAVKGAQQGQGVGRAIMQDILTWLAAHAHPTSFVSLAANNGSVGFYTRLGFVACGPEEPRMAHPCWSKTATLPVRQI